MADMLRKLLCKIGRHDMVECVLHQNEYSKLIGFHCSQCKKLAPGMEEIKDLAETYERQSPFFVVDHSWPHFDIVPDEESLH